MAGAAATEDHNAAGNSDFSRKAMELAGALIEKWTAPSATDSERGGVMTDAMTGTSLTQQVGSWAGPKVLQGGPNSNREARGAGGPGLQEQAATWASPLAQNHKGSGTAIYRPDNGKLRDDILSFQAEQLFHPPSSPAPATADGSTSSTASPNSNLPSAKRKLNPIFVEALMRWPTGLSGFARQETAWTQWWQLQRSYLSALDWGSSETAAQHDLFG